ncbi:MAG: hypothetical protein HY924_10275 [Elusimicrobia bacterium]|nr:hypothetical protein [Elusimicrobiota bacterium]
MTSSGVRARSARLFLAGFFLVCAAVFGAAAWDPGRIVESFWEERAEQRFLSVWQRQASPVTWTECRTQPDLCPGKFVVWEVTRPGWGITCYEGNCSMAISWTNEDQVPGASSRGGFTAVAKVMRAEPGSMVLVFLGSPDAPYGGTTRVRGSASSGAVPVHGVRKVRIPVRASSSHTGPAGF